MPKALTDQKAVVFKRRKQLLLRVPTFSTRYFFRLVADNGEIVAQSEAYNEKKNAVATLARYFPQFSIVDETGE